MASLALRSQKTLWPDESEGESHILYMRPTPEKCTILAKYLNLRKFQYTSGNQTPLTTYILPIHQVSSDCRYHKILRARSKGFLYDLGYFQDDRDDSL